jgi:hypothetical protein
VKRSQKVALHLSLYTLLLHNIYIPGRDVNREIKPVAGVFVTGRLPYAVPSIPTDTVKAALGQVYIPG